MKNAFLISPLHHRTITLALPLLHHHLTANQTTKILYQERAYSDDEDSTSSSSNGSDSDSNGDAANNKENQSGAAISRAIRNHSQFKYNDDGKESSEELSTSLHDTNRPLSPWTNSSSKARIINDLKNNDSSIHALVGSGWEANLDEL